MGSSTVERIVLVFRVPIVSQHQLDIPQTLGETGVDHLEQMWEVQRLLGSFCPSARSLQELIRASLFHEQFDYATFCHSQEPTFWGGTVSTGVMTCRCISSMQCEF
jgi:hypothetical protein